MRNHKACGKLEENTLFTFRVKNFRLVFLGYFLEKLIKFHYRHYTHLFIGVGFISFLINNKFLQNEKTKIVPVHVTLT